MTPADLAGVNLRMPGSDAWQFLGKALGATDTDVVSPRIYNRAFRRLGRWPGTIRCNRG